MQRVKLRSPVMATKFFNASKKELKSITKCAISIVINLRNNKHYADFITTNDMAYCIKILLKRKLKKHIFIMNTDLWKSIPKSMQEAISNKDFNEFAKIRRKSDQYQRWKIENEETSKKQQNISYFRQKYDNYSSRFNPYYSTNDYLETCNKDNEMLQEAIFSSLKDSNITIKNNNDEMKIENEVNNFQRKLKIL